MDLKSLTGDCLRTSRSPSAPGTPVEPIVWGIALHFINTGLRVVLCPSLTLICLTLIYH